MSSAVAIIALVSSSSSEDDEPALNGATVSAVSRTNNGETLVKVAPSSDAGTALALTALTSVKLTFPFVSVSASECAVSGQTELHVLVHGNREEFLQAVAAAKERRAMRLLSGLSSSFLGLAVLSYAALLYGSLISL